MYRVFLGAPSQAEITNDPASYSWRTVSSNAASTRSIKQTQSVVLPLATLEEASRRISLVYKDIVFNDDPDESLARSQEIAEPVDASVFGAIEPAQPVEVSVFRGVEQTTLFSWPPSRPMDDSTSSRDSFTAPSFLLDKTSKSIINAESQPPITQTQASQSHFFDTQAESQSLGNYSDASSIARFPSFHFNLHGLTSLAALSEKKFKGSIKINCLLAVLEVEGPDTIRIKKGVDAGKEVSILKMVLGDEEGTVCKLTAWREVAEDWGGAGKAVGAKRGDVVHISNVTAACDPSAATTLTASPYLKSELVICYRTMPYSHEDGRLRPDLRLGISEPSVRKVSALVLWFENLAGL